MTGNRAKFCADKDTTLIRRRPTVPPEEQQEISRELIDRGLEPDPALVKLTNALRKQAERNARHLAD